MKNTKFDEAIEELQIKTHNDERDLKQLEKIIFQILQYPSLNNAKDHQMADSLGETDLLSYEKTLMQIVQNQDERNLQFCDCCGNISQNKGLSCWRNLDSLKLRPNVALFFSNYLYLEFIFLILFILYFCFIISLENPSENDIFQYLTLGSNNSMQIMTIVIVFGILNILKMQQTKKYIVKREMKNPSASLFTLMLSNFPKSNLDNSMERNLQYFQQIFQKYQDKIHSRYTYKVEKVNVGKSYSNISKQKKKIHKKLQIDHENRRKVFVKWIKHRRNNYEFPVSIEERQQEYNNYFNFYHYEYKQFTQLSPTLQEKNIVFVTLSSSKAVEEIVSKNSPKNWKTCWSCCQNDLFPVKGLTISRAPEPEEINWKNIGLRNKNKSNFIAFTVGLVLLLLSIIINGMLTSSESINIENKPILRALIIIVINFLMEKILCHFIKEGKEYFLSKQYSSILNITSFYMVLNMISFPFLLFSYYSLSFETDLLYIGLMNILPAILQIFNPILLLSRLKLFYVSLPYEKLKIYGQKKFNTLYTQPQFNFGEQYAYLISTSVFVAFFAAVSPILLLLGFFGIGIYYIGSKRKLLTHSKRPTPTSANLSIETEEKIYFFPLIFSIGNLLFSTEEEELLFSWMIILVAFCLVFTIMSCLTSLCFSKPYLKKVQYQNCKISFENQYDRMNPATKSEATNEYKNYLQQLEQNSQSSISLLKLNKKNLISGSPRSHVKVTKQMSYLNPQYAKTLIKKERKGSEGAFRLNLQSTETFEQIQTDLN